MARGVEKNAKRRQRRIRPDLKLPKGCSIGPILRNGHYSVLGPDDERLRRENGVPIQVSVTPSDRRTVKTELAKIRAAMAAKEGAR